MSERYLQPGWFMKHAFNPGVEWLTNRGISVMGSRQLRVRGRSSGAWRTTPVNLLTVDDTRYLVAPRGVTQWVRNIRVAGGGELRVGRRIEPFRIEELDEAAKPPVLRAYLKAWKWEVGQFFEDLDAQSSDERIAQVAAGFPVFRILSQ